MRQALPLILSGEARRKYNLDSVADVRFDPWRPVPEAHAMRVRPPAVAGRFYPANPGLLESRVMDLLAAARPPDLPARPQALIVPHAGYTFSGPIAASGYAWLAPCADRIERVVILGTCHTPGVDSLVTSSAEVFQTPLGDVPVDRPAVKAALEQPGVEVDDPAQDRDHSIEVQLPFLQIVVDREFAIVPFLVGHVGPEVVADLLDALWGGDETLVLVSSDLSHHLSYEEAREMDRGTADAIERLDAEALGPRSACGRTAIAGLLHAARRHGLHCRTLDLRSSADTAGPRDRVVGYGAWAFFSTRNEHLRSSAKRAEPDANPRPSEQDAS
jgi:AmmeMemoRadiSam system protein B